MHNIYIILFFSSLLSFSEDYYNSLNQNSQAYQEDGFSADLFFKYSSDDNYDLIRSYLNYTNYSSEKISYKFQAEIRYNSSRKWNLYLKKAFINYKINDKNSFAFGVIDNNFFNIQEQIWNYRFIRKNILEIYWNIPQNDFGVGIVRKNNKTLFSYQITNGEGYKADKVNKYFTQSYQFLAGELDLINNSGAHLGIITSSIDNGNEEATTIIGGGYIALSIRDIILMLEAYQYSREEFDSINLSWDNYEESLMSYSLNYKICMILNDIIL